jgi:glutamyl/glutaminyl-tRNA synthetase
MADTGGGGNEPPGAVRLQLAVSRARWGSRRISRRKPRQYQQDSAARFRRLSCLESRRLPAYELAVVVDDLAMGVTEVVRGADLLTSTARQILIYRALRAEPPAFFHCPLVLDKDGRRLAKRDSDLSLRALRAHGYSPEDVIAQARALTAKYIQ